MGSNATSLIREALAGSGVELVASCGAGDFDARAPEELRARVLFAPARGVVVVGSAGRELWRQFRVAMAGDPQRWDRPHPFDDHVAGVLARGDAALASGGVAFRRFEPTSHAWPRLDFVALARLVGLGGGPGPFGMSIHREHGAWWALRGAWLVDAEVDPPLPADEPCAGCSAPCVAGWDRARGLAPATPEARAACVVGQSSRYTDEQISYHYDRAAALARLRRRPG